MVAVFQFTVCGFLASFLSRSKGFDAVSLSISNGSPWWDEGEVHQLDAKPDMSLFDSPQLLNGGNEGAIGMQTVRDISKAYHFSMAFLGDTIIQLGIEPPLDVDARIGDLMNSEKLSIFLESLNSLDPTAVNIEYDSMSLHELAEDLEAPLQMIKMVCDEAGMNLPYGISTTLHQSVVEEIKELCNGEYDYLREVFAGENDDE